MNDSSWRNVLKCHWKINDSWWPQSRLGCRYVETSWLKFQRKINVSREPQSRLGCWYAEKCCHLEINDSWCPQSRLGCWHAEKCWLNFHRKLIGSWWAQSRLGSWYAVKSGIRFLQFWFDFLYIACDFLVVCEVTNKCAPLVPRVTFDLICHTLLVLSLTFQIQCKWCYLCMITVVCDLWYDWMERRWEHPAKMCPGCWTPRISWLVLILACDYFMVCVYAQVMLGPLHLNSSVCSSMCGRLGIFNEFWSGNVYVLCCVNVTTCIRFRLLWLVLRDVAWDRATLVHFPTTCAATTSHAAVSTDDTTLVDIFDARSFGWFEYFRSWFAGWVGFA